MKKRKAISLLLAGIFLLLTGCESQPQYSTENTYVAGQDFQYQFYKAIGTNLSPLPIAETEDSYYFLVGQGFLYYADKETMEAVLLCSRPDCLHDQEPKEQKRLECNAYFPNSGTVFCTDGFLYIPCDKSDYNVSDPSSASGQLLKVSTDGTSREPLFDLYSETCLRFHRGMLYYLDSPTGDESGEGNMALFRRALKKDSQPEQLAQFQTSNVPEITLYGNNAYIRLNSSLLHVDLETTEQTAIAQTSSENSCTLIGFRQNKLVYALRENGEAHYYLSELDGENPIAVPAMDGRSFLQVDDQYFYDVDIDFMSANKPAEKCNVRVLQEDGTLVSEFPIGMDGALLAMASDKYVFKVAMSQEEKNWQFDYAEKSGIETGQMEWKTVVSHTPVESDGVTYTG